MSSSITRIQVTNDSTQSYVKNKVDFNVCVMMVRVKYEITLLNIDLTEIN